jgi:hypothetical protein
MVGVIVHVVVALASLAGGHGDQALRQIFFILPMVAFVQFGCITVVFAMVDRYVAKSQFEKAWNPRELPAAADVTNSRWSQPMTGLVILAVFGVWWFAGLRYPPLIFGPAAAIVTFAPIWRSLFVPMVLLALADIASQLIALARPHWTTLRSVTHITVSLASLVVVGLLLSTGDLIVLTDAGARAVAGELASNQVLVTIVNRTIQVALAIVGVITIVRELVEIRCLCRRSGPGAPVHV